MKFLYRLLTVSGVVFGLAGGSAVAHEVLDFDEDVGPILQKNCGGGGCHIGEKTSGAEYTSFETLMLSVGEQYGSPLVVPGRPELSPLIDKISSAQPRFGVRMPFGAPPLSDQDVNTLRQWVRDGAVARHRPLRGDVDQNEQVNITDAVSLLNFLFGSGDEPECLALANADSVGGVNITDAVFLLQFLFSSGPSPAPMTEEEVASCEEARELSFANIYSEVLAKSCAFSSCHGAEGRKGDLSFESPEVAYNSLVGIEPFNVAAREAGLLRVAPGMPDASFLVTKLVQPGPGEGNRMPANSPVPLSPAIVNAFREWIRAGAPFEGTVQGVPAITPDPAPEIERIPQPPVPDNGLQIHLEPFAIGPRSEREIFSFVDRPFAHLDTNEILVKRIDIHMAEESHHFIAYEWLGTTKPPAGVRPIGGTVDLISKRRFQVGSQQSFFTIAFPEGVGIKFTKNTSFDLNSHFVNLNGEKTLMGEVYVNIFFAAPGSIKTFVKPLFEINPFINVPPNQTRTTKWTFPNLTTAIMDPGLGFLGRLSRETHIYSLTSHTHRHGVRFSAFLIQNGRDVNPPRMIYDNFSWDDPVYTVFDPPMVLQPGQGIRFETTHTYDDPPSPNSPPLTFDLTSEDEMAILLGYYATP